MKFRLIHTVIIIIIGMGILKAQSNGEITIGTKHFIKSEILSEEREYWVSLPNSYDVEQSGYKKYPILILLDGNSHFHYISGMVNSMSSGNTDKREIPEMIIVGILNVNRERDFTPDKIITKRENQTGGGDNFLAFLEKEVIPRVDSTYRTEPYRMLVGHSLAGLITTHSYMKENSPFNSFISIDPSFGSWDDQVIDKKTTNLNEVIFKRPLFLATANWGKRNLRNRDRHIQFFETLHSKSNRTFNAKHQYYSDKNHSSVPILAIYDGLSYIFEGYNQSYRNVTEINKLIQNYEELSEKHAHDFLPPEELVNRIGYRLLRSSEIKDNELALEFFKLNTENYPKSYNVFDSLAEAHYKLGNEKEAIESYAESIVLNPENENASKMIKQIKETIDNK